MNMTLRILDLSTGHLRRSTREFLSNAAFDDIPLSLTRGPYGFMIWAGDEEKNEETYSDVPSELGAIVGADMPGIEYVRFDMDADQHEHFDWYGDSETLQEPGNPEAPLDNGKGSTTPRIAVGETIWVETAGATLEISRLPEGDAIRVSVHPEGGPEASPTDMADLSMPPEKLVEDGPSF